MEIYTMRATIPTSLQRNTYNGPPSSSSAATKTSRLSRCRFDVSSIGFVVNGETCSRNDMHAGIARHGCRLNWIRTAHFPLIYLSATLSDRWRNCNRWTCRIEMVLRQVALLSLLQTITSRLTQFRACNSSRQLEKRKTRLRFVEPVIATNVREWTAITVSIRSMERIRSIAV